VTPEERRAALDAIAAEVRTCTNCRLSAGRAKAVPGEGHPDTEVVFVGEGPGFNEDRQGRPFVGRAGDLLVKMLGTLGWRREEVFITNVVKCRPPDNRDPEPDEVAACLPYLHRQLEILDPALVVTLAGTRWAASCRARASARSTGRRARGSSYRRPQAMVYALYHPAAALRSTEVERQSFDDVAGIPRRCSRQGDGDPPPWSVPGVASAVGVANAAAPTVVTGLPDLSGAVRPTIPVPSLDPITLF
jgi:DNA polymerase